MLDNEEVKHLLKKSTDFEQTTQMLSEDDREIVIELFKKPFEALAKSISKILGKESSIGEITADIANAGLLKETLGEDYYLADAVYKSGLSTFAFENSAVKKMATILLETIYEEGELTETEINSFKEIFSQMISGLGKSLSSEVDATVELSETDEPSKITELSENVLQFSVGLTVNEDINTTFYYYISYDVLNTLIKVAKSKIKDEPEEEHHKEAERTHTEELEESTATVSPIQFEELTDDLIADEKENMNLLMDLQLQVSVELGKVKKPIKDILQFTQGTIVELDRLAGDNVDVLVSGKIIAKGEVVVVDQNFGVRITKIVLPEKRV